VVGGGPRQLRPADEREEQALEVAAGVVLVGLDERDEVGERAGAVASRRAGERGADVLWLEPPEVLRALDDLPQRAAFEDRGEVDERP
jgi:hypothetical protein